MKQWFFNNELRSKEFCLLISKTNSYYYFNFYNDGIYTIIESLTLRFRSEINRQALLNIKQQSKIIGIYHKGVNHGTKQGENNIQVI
jgi:hypothetical protein